jgi:hypothetical protein
MKKTNQIYLQNAFTSTPIQDQFNQLGFLPQGLTRIEYIALQLYKNDIDTIKDCIVLAKQFIDEIEKFKEELENKPTTLEIIK